MFFTDKSTLTSFRGKRLLCFKLKIQRLFVNRRREMVNFELGKEKAENVFRLVTSVARGIRRSEVRLVEGIQNFFFVPRS